MARGRSVKDGKDARKDGPEHGTKAPDETFLAPSAMEDLAERIAVLEARVELVEATMAVAEADAVAPELVEVVPCPLESADAPAANGVLNGAAPPDADPHAHPDTAPDTETDAAPDPDDVHDHDGELDGLVPGGPTPSQLRARHGKAGGLSIVGAARLPKGVRATWSRDVSAVELLDRDWAAGADALAALGHPVRLAVVREVLRGSRSVPSLAALPGVGTSGQLYHHIKPLLAAGWLRQDGRGRYEVPESRVMRLLTLMAALEA